MHQPQRVSKTIELQVTCNITANVCSEPAGHSCYMGSMTCTPAVVFTPQTGAHSLMTAIAAWQQA